MPKTAKSKKFTAKAAHPYNKVGKTKIKSTSAGYFHDLDPYSFHPTKAAATADRQRLSKIASPNVPIKSRSERETTLYTILHDKRKNGSTKFRDKPQGPHTIPHWGTHHALVNARANDTLDTFPVLPPADYNKRLDVEIPVGHQKRAKAELAELQYKKNHDTYLALKAVGATTGRDESQDIKFAHTINKLVQLDPFATTGYKSASPAKKRATAGKGERSTDPIEPQIDWPSTKYNDHDAFKDHVKDTLKTLSDFDVD